MSDDQIHDECDSCFLSICIFCGREFTTYDDWCGVCDDDDCGLFFKAFPIEEDMSDICACPGFNCPLKERCKRYTMKKSEYQYYFTANPQNEGGCDYFISSYNREPKKNEKKKTN